MVSGSAAPLYAPGKSRLVEGAEAIRTARAAVQEMNHRFVQEAWTVLCGFASLALAAEPASPGQTPTNSADVTITVGSQPRQTFEGLGASGWGAGDYMRLAPERRAELNDLLWRQARFNTLRIWFHLKDYAPAPGLRHFKDAFSDNLAALVRDAQAASVKHLVLGPSAIPSYLMERVPAKGQDGNGQRVEPLSEAGPI